MSKLVIVDDDNRDDLSRKAGCYLYTGAQLRLDDDALHSAEGPALVSPDGAERWYIHGKEVTREVKTFFYENRWSVERGLDTEDKRTRFVARFIG